MCTRSAPWTKILRPIGYFSKTLTDTERNYDTTEKECLAIIWATPLLRPYSEGTLFILRTAHDPLKWLFARQATGKLARCWLKLQEFDFKLEYLRGTKNAIAYATLQLKTNGGEQRN